VEGKRAKGKQKGRKGRERKGRERKWKKKGREKETSPSSHFWPHPVIETRRMTQSGREALCVEFVAWRRTRCPAIMTMFERNACCL